MKGNREYGIILALFAAAAFFAWSFADWIDGKADAADRFERKAAAHHATVNERIKCK